MLQTAKLAVSDINQHGGVAGRKLKISVEDNASDPAKSASTAQDLLQKGADVIITSCDYNIGGPAARVAGTAGKVAIGCAGSELYGAKGIGPLTFNTYVGAATEGAVLAQYAIQRGWKTAFTLADQLLAITKDTCKYFEQAYRKLGGQIVGSDTFSNGDPSVATQVRDLQGAQPATAVLCSLPPGGASALKQIRDVYPGPVLSGMDGTEWLSSVPGLSDYYTVSVGAVKGDPSADRGRIYSEYQKATGEAAPSPLIIMGYAAIQTLAAGVRKAGTPDGQKLAAALETLHDEEFVTGPVTYTKSCHIPSGLPMVMQQYADNDAAYLATVKPSFVPQTIC